MKRKKKPDGKTALRSRERSPELIEKFYKQIVNSFGYAYPAKV
ncbi:MAG: hypothetical protein WAZ98_09980 [Cyclobacteriaceae bacterium]